MVNKKITLGKPRKGHVDCGTFILDLLDFPVKGSPEWQCNIYLTIPGPPNRQYSYWLINGELYDDWGIHNDINLISETLANVNQAIKEQICAAVEKWRINQ